MSGRNREKEVILTSLAPQPIGPYSQAIKANGFIFCSGQIGLDPRTGQVAGPDVETQARRAMENLKAVLEEAGVGFDSVVKTTIFLKSMSDFPRVNETVRKRQLQTFGPHGGGRGGRTDSDRDEEARICAATEF